MDAPKCKTCGDRHTPGPCPKFQRSASVVSVPWHQSKPKAKFDRNAYQRELMRKRRAKAKSAKATALNLSRG